MRRVYQMVVLANDLSLPGSNTLSTGASAFANQRCQILFFSRFPISAFCHWVRGL
jgi:hypothetical protein